MLSCRDDLGNVSDVPPSSPPLISALGDDLLKDIDELGVIPSMESTDTEGIMSYFQQLQHLVMKSQEHLETALSYERSLTQTLQSQIEERDTKLHKITSSFSPWGKSPHALPPTSPVVCKLPTVEENSSRCPRSKLVVSPCSTPLAGTHARFFKPVSVGSTVGSSSTSSAPSLAAMPPTVSIHVPVRAYESSRSSSHSGARSPSTLSSPMCTTFSPLSTFSATLPPTSTVRIRTDAPPSSLPMLSSTQHHRLFHLCEPLVVAGVHLEYDPVRGVLLMRALMPPSGARTPSRSQSRSSSRSASVRLRTRHSASLSSHTPPLLPTYFPPPAADNVTASLPPPTHSAPSPLLMPASPYHSPQNSPRSHGVSSSPTFSPCPSPLPRSLSPHPSPSHTHRSPPLSPRVPSLSPRTLRSRLSSPFTAAPSASALAHAHTPSTSPTRADTHADIAPALLVSFLSLLDEADTVLTHGDGDTPYPSRDADARTCSGTSSSPTAADALPTATMASLASLRTRVHDLRSRARELLLRNQAHASRNAASVAATPSVTTASTEGVEVSGTSDGSSPVTSIAYCNDASDEESGASGDGASWAAACALYGQAEIDEEKMVKDREDKQEKNVMPQREETLEGAHVSVLRVVTGSAGEVLETTASVSTAEMHHIHSPANPKAVQMLVCNETVADGGLSPASSRDTIPFRSYGGALSPSSPSSPVNLVLARVSGDDHPPNNHTTSFSPSLPTHMHAHMHAQTPASVGAYCRLPPTLTQSRVFTHSPPAEARQLSTTPIHTSSPAPTRVRTRPLPSPSPATRARTPIRTPPPHSQALSASRTPTPTATPTYTRTRARSSSQRVPPGVAAAAIIARVAPSSPAVAPVRAPLPHHMDPVAHALGGGVRRASRTVTRSPMLPYSLGMQSPLALCTHPTTSAHITQAQVQVYKPLGVRPLRSPVVAHQPSHSPHAPASPGPAPGPQLPSVQ